MQTADVNSRRCWACDHDELSEVKPGNSGSFSSSDFAITDHRYGTTGTLVRCRGCGFVQCIDSGDAKVLTAFYEKLIDPDYEATRAQRLLQAERLLTLLHPFRQPGRQRLLDIGAGSGILVEAAVRRGFSPIGIEPSRWLADQALQRNLPVVCGVLPHDDIRGEFDFVTLVDVLEHVAEPLALLQEAAGHLARDGAGLLVVPDAGSFTARLLGFRWWHYRIAHVGYFNHTALGKIIHRAGLEIVDTGRPAWYFPLDYLWTRLRHYLPFLPDLPRRLGRLTVPLNLFDSSWIIFRHRR